MALHTRRNEQRKPDHENSERHEPSSRPPHQDSAYELNQQLEERNRNGDWYEQWLGCTMEELARCPECVGTVLEQERVSDKCSR